MTTRKRISLNRRSQQHDVRFVSYIISKNDKSDIQEIQSKRVEVSLLMEEGLYDWVA